MPPAPAPPPSPLVGPALAFTAGFADASTFVGAGGIFCAHVTGNFVVLAADLALHAGADQWLKLATFPVFVAAVLAATAYHHRLARGLGPRSARALLAMKSALFGLAALVGVLAPTSAPGRARVAIVVILVIAMALQNAVHRLNPAFGPMTTVMTGNVTGWVSDALAPATQPDAAERAARRTQLGFIILLFTLGCAAGALSVVRLGFVVMVVPMLVTLGARSRLARPPPDLPPASGGGSGELAAAHSSMDRPLPPNPGGGQEGGDRRGPDGGDRRGPDGGDRRGPDGGDRRGPDGVDRRVPDGVDRVPPWFDRTPPTFTAPPTRS
jgi:uncharacterized membrane protein YoaK (UPF0700 family)